MDAIIDREETIQKEEVKDNTIAVTVQCKWRILEDKDNEIEFILSASPSLMKIVNLWLSEILTEIYNEINSGQKAKEEKNKGRRNSDILIGQRNKIDESELIELFEQNWNSLVQKIEESLLTDGIEKVLIDDVQEFEEIDNTMFDMNSKFEWTHTPEHLQLAERMKGDHLSKEHCKYLSHIFRRHPDHKNLIWQAYKISRSTYRRIMNKSMHTIAELKHESMFFKHNHLIKPEIWEYIDSMVRPPKFPMTLSKIRNEIFQTFGIKYSIHKIRKYLKDELRYTYRKGSSRPCRYNVRRIQLIKELFCSELLQIILSKEIIINVDECSFDRTLKQAYSWFPRGKSWAVINAVYQGKANLILATISNGDWFAIVHAKTWDSIKFCLFLKLLNILWAEYRLQANRLPTVLMDNASIHTSKFSKEICSTLNMNWRFTPPYWSEVAPVEQIFKIVKSKLTSSNYENGANFVKTSGKKLILELISNLSKRSWHSAWTNVLTEWRKVIVLSFRNSGCCN